MDKVEDKMVEIARFQYVEQAQGLASLLQANGVVCYVRNEYTTQVMGLTDVGLGIRRFSYRHFERSEKSLSFAVRRSMFGILKREACYRALSAPSGHLPLEGKAVFILRGT